MSNANPYAPVIAGLVIGILLVVILGFVFRPAFAKSDEEPIAETKELKEVQFLLSRYNDVESIVDRETERGRWSFHTRLNGKFASLDQSSLVMIAPEHLR